MDVLKCPCLSAPASSQAETQANVPGTSGVPIAVFTSLLASNWDMAQRYSGEDFIDRPSR